MSYFQELDAWLTAVLLVTDDDRTEEEWFARVKKQLKDKILESYRNGQKAGLEPAKAKVEDARERPGSLRKAQNSGVSAVFALNGGGGSHPPLGGKREKEKPRFLAGLCSAYGNCLAYPPTLCRKPASFPVALNWGIGSSSLRAEVKAFDRLHIVREPNASPKWNALLK